MSIIYPKGDHDFNGIINHLFTTQKQSFYDFVSIDGYPANRDGWSEKWVLITPSYIGPPFKDSWCSDPNPNAYFTVHFAFHQLYISHFTLRARTFNVADMIKGWDLFGSNNNINWTIIDSRTNINDLLTSGSNKTYQVQYPGKYSFFKMIQTQSSGNMYFGLSKIEFFGRLISTSSLFETCLKKQSFFTSQVGCILLIFVVSSA